MRVTSNLVQYRSFDDKSFFRAGTSTGMQSTRAQRLYMANDEETGFGHYDFPEKMVNGTFLYMHKDVKEVNGEEKVLITSYDTLCQIKPKFFVGSGNG